MLKCYWAWLAINRSRVRVPAAALLSSTWASCLHTCASVKQYNLVPANGRWYSAAGEVTSGGLALSNGSLPPGLWLRSPAGWLPRTGLNSTLVSSTGVHLPLTLTLKSAPQIQLWCWHCAPYKCSYYYYYYH